MLLLFNKVDKVCVLDNIQFVLSDTTRSGVFIRSRARIVSLPSRADLYTQGIQGRTRSYTELSEVRPSYLERPTPNIGTIRSPASYKIILRLKHQVLIGQHQIFCSLNRSETIEKVFIFGYLKYISLVPRYFDQLQLCCSLKGLNNSSNIAGRLYYLDDQRQACNYSM